MSEPSLQEKADVIFKANFPKKLSELIDASKYTRSSFAKKINVSAPTITHWCQGKKQPRSTHIAKICEALNVSWDELLFGSSEIFPGLSSFESDLIRWFRDFAKEEEQGQIIEWVNNYRYERARKEELNEIIKNAQEELEGLSLTKKEKEREEQRRISQNIIRAKRGDQP